MQHNAYHVAEWLIRLLLDSSIDDLLDLLRQLVLVNVLLQTQTDRENLKWGWDVAWNGRSCWTEQYSAARQPQQVPTWTLMATAFLGQYGLAGWRGANTDRGSFRKIPVLANNMHR